MQEGKSNRFAKRPARGPETIQSALDALERYHTRHMTNLVQQIHTLGSLIEMYEERGELEQAHHWLEKYASDGVRAHPEFLSMLGQVGKRLGV